MMEEKNVEGKEEERLLVISWLDGGEIRRYPFFPFGNYPGRS
jgi:hypothetical protein